MRTESSWPGQLAGVRKETFITPPSRRNRLWQADFSDVETDAAGNWVLGGVVDYFAKVNLACEVGVTRTASDAIAFFEKALAEVEVLLGVDGIEDLTDPHTGEIGRLRLVTDNGSAFNGKRFAAWVASKRHIVHIRTRKKAPWTNGVIERWFWSVKYERLYRHDIGDGGALARHVVDHRTIYHAIRPHETIGMATPLSLYLLRNPNFPAPLTDFEVLGPHQTSVCTLPGGIGRTRS